MHQSLLADRAILSVSGPEAEAFLNRLFTRNLAGLAEGEARYAALLSPQGKLVVDVLVYRSGDALLLDGPAHRLDALAKKLSLFKLRAKVTIEPRPTLAVAAVWDGAPSDRAAQAFRDPRHPALGWRVVGPAANLAAQAGDGAAYEQHRIHLGIPRGGIDFAYDDAFVHEANLDLLHGVDFDKGCYVGQEVVSRVQHRNSARKRIVKVQFYGEAPAPGTPLSAGPSAIGTLTSRAGTESLATARIDRLAEAEAAKVPVLAGETLVTITLPTANDASHAAG